MSREHKFKLYDEVAITRNRQKGTTLQEVLTWEDIQTFTIKDIFNSEWTMVEFIGVLGYEGEYDDRHKNEVELYEGDIVEAMSEGSKGTFVIRFRQEASPCYILFPAWQCCKGWKIHGSNIGRKDGKYFDELKRIGNIYQNPELIKL